jgi:hypothetical protein
MRLEDGLAVYYEGVQAVSQLVAHRELLLRYYTEIEQSGKLPHFHEPGISKKQRDIYAAREFASDWPNIDIRHPGTITGGDKFRKTAVKKTGQKRKYFQIEKEIPYWGRSYKRPIEFINEICGKE